MSKKILCKKLNKELPALSVPPMPGPKGQEIMESISEEAWEMWKSHQTTLINEKHLDMSDQENRKWLQDQMEKFFNKRGTGREVYLYLYSGSPRNYFQS